MGIHSDTGLHVQGLGLRHLSLNRAAAAPAVPGLLLHLGEALGKRGVAYCQWKGHWKQWRWATGQGDLDLLMGRASRRLLQCVLADLGFRAVTPPPQRQLPGVESYIGVDPDTRLFLHVHVHYRLVLGSYGTTCYYLPIEAPLLASVVPGPVFPVPAPELELLLFVLRMVQRYAWRDAIRRGEPRWLTAAKLEFDYLETRSEPARLNALLAQHVPSIEPSFFGRARRSLRGETTWWTRLALRRGLHRRLAPYARPPAPSAVLLTLARRLTPAWCDRGAANRMRLATGGTVVALVGADGAGKSTCTRALHRWLAPTFATMTAHLGRPPRSLLTLIVGGARNATRGRVRLLDLLRYVCTARDRYRLYAKACRFAAAGGVALCERYPVPENQALVGPCIERYLVGTPITGLAKRLRDREVRYYRRIMPPDLLIVLNLPPDLAVRRKTNEPADYVRTRAGVVWHTDWSATRAHVVDASRPLTDVVAELQGLIWKEA